MKFSLWKAIGNAGEVKSAYKTGRAAVKNAEKTLDDARLEGQISVEEAIGIAIAAREAVRAARRQFDEIERLTCK